VLSEPNTERSRQLVSLGATALAAIAARRMSGTGTEWIFAGKKNAALEPREVNREFDRVQRLAALRHFRFHDLRHACAISRSSARCTSLPTPRLRTSGQ
jgi:integrase